jgi:hypothetical protein
MIVQSTLEILIGGMAMGLAAILWQLKVHEKRKAPIPIKSNCGKKEKS